MEIQSSAYEEVLEIFEYLDVHLPRKMDGKTAILEMKEGGSRKAKNVFPPPVATEITPLFPLLSHLARAIFCHSLGSGTLLFLLIDKNGLI